MRTRGYRLVALAVVVCSVAVPARSGATPARDPTGVAGSWHRLPVVPIATNGTAVGVWTGRQVLVFGRATLAAPWSTNVAAAYTVGMGAWQRLRPPAGEKGNYEGSFAAVWTGREMLVWGPRTQLAFNPSTRRWRNLPPSPLEGRGPPGLVVWSGREMVGWGGGCCGDAYSDGAAYSPATNTWRMLAGSPLAGSQTPQGAWTGRELVLLVSGNDPDGHVLPARFARAAVYNPATDTWRRIAVPPAPRPGARAVWDGRELLVVGGVAAAKAGRPGTPATIGFAYDAAANRWRALPRMESGRLGAAAVWTGARLFLWGGRTALDTDKAVAPHGLAYDPKTNRWSALPMAPVRGRVDSTAVWTGREMFVWGGTSLDGKPLPDGATFTPATP